MSSRNPLFDVLGRALKLLMIAGLVLIAFVLTSFIGVGLLLAWFLFRLVRRARSPAKPVHGPQVFEGEFEVVRRPQGTTTASLSEPAWPRPFDSTRPG